LFQYVTTAVDPTSWIDVGLIQGPPGEIGVDGSTGPTGPTGPMTDEVYIGPDDPTVPQPQAELWFDTDDTRILGPTDLPIGGLVGQFLIKKTDLDGDVEWTGVTGRSAVVGDNAGFLMAGNGGIFKKSGGGWVLRRHNNNAAIPIENNDGTGGSDIVIANGNVPMTGTLKWGNAEGDKIYLYPGATPGTNSYGFGISASAMALFVPDNAVFRFRDGGGHDGGSEYMTLTNNSCVINGNTDINGGLTPNSIDVSNSHIQISGSDSTNSAHFYVNANSNNNGTKFTLLEGRRADMVKLVKLMAMQTGYSGSAPESQFKVEVGGGDDGWKEVFQAEMDEGDGQAWLYVHGICSSTHFDDHSSRKTKDNLTPVDPILVGQLMDRLHAKTYTRPILPGEGASEIGKNRPPARGLALDVEDVEEAGIYVDHLVTDRAKDHESRGFSIGGMLALAITEIKSLRARVAQLEAGGA
jgi:hypothetical protein